MSLLYAVVFASRCRSNHHRINGMEFMVDHSKGAMGRIGRRIERGPLLPEDFWKEIPERTIKPDVSRAGFGAKRSCSPRRPTAPAPAAC